MESVDFSGADLRGANLSFSGFCDVIECTFTGAIIDSTTILPDGLSFDPETGEVVKS